MHALSPSILLDVWGQGVAQPAVQKALLLLGAAFPEEPPSALAQRSIGQRNALLLTLRERLFGSRFLSVATCPQCGESLELSFETADIRSQPADPIQTQEGTALRIANLAGGQALPGCQALALDVGDHSVRFRLPNSADLAVVQGYEDPAAVQRVLLEQCLLWVEHTGEEIPAAALPDEVVEVIAACMERADPQANVDLSLTCPACAHEWQALMDIVDYLWRELDAWARRALREVHDIASAYGWSEHDILTMRPGRRQIYVEMIGR